MPPAQPGVRRCFGLTRASIRAAILRPAFLRSHAVPAASVVDLLICSFEFDCGFTRTLCLRTCRGRAIRAPLCVAARQSTLRLNRESVSSNDAFVCRHSLPLVAGHRRRRKDWTSRWRWRGWRWRTARRRSSPRRINWAISGTIGATTFAAAWQNCSSGWTRPRFRSGVAGRRRANRTRHGRRGLRGDVLTLGDHRRHVLLELPHELYLPLEPVLERAFAARRWSGILSHPERNQGILRQPDVLAPLVDAGCLLQITAGSLCGTFGPECQQFSEWLLAEGMVHFVATDAHGPRSRRPLMRRAFERVVELTDEATAIDLCSVQSGPRRGGRGGSTGRRRDGRAGGASWFFPSSATA